LSGTQRVEISELLGIYWGCFYFFPWLRTWRREKRVHPATFQLPPGRCCGPCHSRPPPAPSRCGRGMARELSEGSPAHVVLSLGV
uniref:Uncharacterized protein n=1 Tax=Chrysemys picta bellii TaxID=8478 RepID=A0A8C3FAU1_CHRPI